MKAIQKQQQFYQKAKTMRKYKHLKNYLEKEEKEKQVAIVPTPTPAPVQSSGINPNFYDKLFNNQGLDDRDKEELESFIKQQYRRPKREKRG